MRWISANRKDILEKICIGVEWKDQWKNLPRYVDYETFLTNLSGVESYRICLDKDTKNPNKSRRICPFLKDYGDLKGECLIKETKPSGCLKYGSSCIWVPSKR